MPTGRGKAWRNIVRHCVSFVKAVVYFPIAVLLFILKLGAWVIAQWRRIPKSLQACAAIATIIGAPIALWGTVITTWSFFDDRSVIEETKVLSFVGPSPVAASTPTPDPCAGGEEPMIESWLSRSELASPFAHWDDPNWFISVSSAVAFRLETRTLRVRRILPCPPGDEFYRNISLARWKVRTFQNGARVELEIPVRAVIREAFANEAPGLYEFQFEIWDSCGQVVRETKRVQLAYREFFRNPHEVLEFHHNERFFRAWSRGGLRIINTATSGGFRQADFRRTFSCPESLYIFGSFVAQPTDASAPLGIVFSICAACRENEYPCEILTFVFPDGVEHSASIKKYNEEREDEDVHKSNTGFTIPMDGASRTFFLCQLRRSETGTLFAELYLSASASELRANVTSSEIEPSFSREIDDNELTFPDDVVVAMRFRQAGFTLLDFVEIGWRSLPSGSFTRLPIQ